MNVAIYIRKSREEKDKPSHRLTVQREQLPAYAKQQGWTVETYDDGHSSAAHGKTDQLKQRARLEADIRAGKINIILCIELSRLSRDDTLQDYVAWLDICSKHNVKLATMSRTLDPAQHSDWMLLLMEGGFSSVEMRILKQRMTDGWHQAYRQGKWLGGTPPPPYSYDARQSRPIIDPDQLPRMQQIWNMAETMSARAIAQEMNLPEITVRRAISDDRLLICQAQRIDPDTSQIIPCDWEPCLTPEQAASIRHGRRSRKNSTAPRVQYASLLSAMQLIYCGYCGATAKTWQGKPSRISGLRTDYYGCQKKNGRTCQQSRMIQQHQLDHLITTNMLNTLADTDHLRHCWEINQGENSTAESLAKLAKRQQINDQKKQRLIAAITNGIVQLADARKQMDIITDELTAIHTERSTIISSDQPPPDWDSLSIPRTEYIALTISEQRDIIRAAIQRIDIYHSYARITYPFPTHENGSKTSRIPLPPPIK